MSRQQTERSIPHLRDIFGFHGWEPQPQQPDPAAAVAQKLQEMRVDASNDSAVSVGSTSEDDSPQKGGGGGGGGGSGKKKKQRNSRRDNARTLTERDVKHLERHLSMKKTIRKKIMRDLQQAFVEDPNEFRVEDISPEQLKAEINIQSLSFGAPQKRPGKKAAAEPNFLDMLRAGSAPGGRVVNDDEDSGHGSPTRESPGGRLADCGYADDDDEDVGEGYEPEPEPEAAKKTSFWRRFTMKGRNKR
ncbi:uncharacterized protein LOC126181380 [Schistocerca cancellata]|uniref:uncharacterized protein LOC126181380 n=1 Tax=Schistocerca cancellata TaxID=274614 RepID=UPI002117B20D|nr:uncharacterized protein LOC126181380 [Schistocerca cancellata]XP_049780724.1 uncharacterized protein LOC126181380 [Schistocerca cancellata]XP_049780725.1 uncharacterized protein LOC126181380 [Schistocerca cancellata]